MNSTFELFADMSNKTYAEFEQYMRKIINITYQTCMALPVWYVKITKNCNKCSQKMDIYKKDSDSMYYHCTKCRNLYNFTNIDLNNNVVYNEFNNFVNTN